MIPPIRWRRVPIECATPPGLTSMRPGAVRPIVPMRSDRIGPGAVRLPLRAAAGDGGGPGHRGLGVSPLARGGGRVHHSLVHVLHAIHVNSMEE